MKKPLSSYEILNVPYDATQRDIHAAYRKLAMAWHPDRHSDNHRSAANKHFKMLQDAYETIKTADNRESYNKWLRKRSAQTLVRQNNIVNDNKPLKSFFDTLETIFWPIDRKQ
jgi:curved DNA-binding protein CbpA